MTREELLATLRATSDRISDAARGLSPRQLARHPKEGEWSLGKILKHLVLGERDVILPRLKRMVHEEAPVFPSSAVNRTGFAAEPWCHDFGIDLAEFRQIREETVSFLQNLADSHWQRIGTTPTRGTLTIEAYARYLAQHDLEHLAQFEATRAVLAEQPLPY